MRRVVPTLCVLLICAAHPAVASPVVNGDFEADTIKPWAWGKSEGCEASGKLDAAERHSGRRSFKMTSASPQQPHVFAGVSQRLQLAPEKKYRVTLWCKGKAVGHCWAGGGKTWKQRKTLPAGDFDWTQVSFIIETDDEAAFELHINVDGTTEALWLDDMEVTEAGSAPTTQAFPPTRSPGLSPSARLYPVPTSGAGPVLKLRANDEQQFGADLVVSYETQGLFLDVNVLDPTPGPASAGEGMWEQDCVQVAIDTDPAAPKSGYGGSCFELGFALLKSNQVARHAWHAGGGPFDFDPVRCEGTREATGYRLRIHIDWASIGLNPRELPPGLGLNIVVSDGQGPKGRRFVEWTPGVATYKGPGDFAHLVRIGSDAPSLAALRLRQPVYASDEVVSARFSEFAYSDLAEDQLSIALRSADGAAHPPLASVTIPAISAGETREALVTFHAGSIAEGRFVLVARSARRGEVAAASFERLDLQSRIPPRLAQLQTQLDHLNQTIQSSPNTADDAYVKLGAAVVERYLARVRSGGPDGKQDARWSWLQLTETASVLAHLQTRLQKLTAGTMRPQTIRPPFETLQIDDGFWATTGADGVSRPWFLYGYGHFAQVSKDAPALTTLGATLIQQELGPTALQPDGTLNPQADRTIAKLQSAWTAGMRVDLLLSPHYFPSWAVEQAPDVAIQSSGTFIKFNIDHPKAREVIETYLRAFVPRVKDQPALASLCLANEPVYRLSGADEHSRPQWLAYLQSVHSDIHTLNALYGTQYAAFTDVPVPAQPTGDNLSQRRAYFDWLVFNQRHLASWLAWMNGIVKEHAPDVPTHIKVMGQIFSSARLYDGTDPELISGVTDLAGNDCWAYPPPAASTPTTGS